MSQAIHLLSLTLHIYSSGVSWYQVEVLYIPQPETLYLGKQGAEPGTLFCKAGSSPISLQSWNASPVDVSVSDGPKEEGASHAACFWQVGNPVSKLRKGYVEMLKWRGE